MTKNELQESAARRLAKSRRLVCMWGTGVGKTRVALRFLEENPSLNCLILVPEDDNIKNWRAEFQKFNVPDDNVTIACYASLHKFLNTEWGLVVLDEVPHTDTEKRTAMLKTIRSDYVLALGAVVDEEEMNSIQSVYGQFDISHITLEQAIDAGWISSVTVNILHLQMDDTKPRFWFKGKAYTEKGYYAILNNKVDSAVNAFNLKANKFNKMKMLTAGNERKRFLGSRKEDAIRRICEKIEEKGRRYLCFCSSIEQAEKLGGDNAYTSKSPKSQAHLEKFNNHEINSLFVVGKLIEGQNLKDIDCGIIGQLGGTERISVQQIGRIIRSANPVVYIPVFDGTKDDSFLYTVTSNISRDCIKHYKF